jgi:type IV pilus assembly protein PilM
MANPFSHFARVEFAPPDYIALPTAGIDISASGIKTVMLKEHLHGLEVDGLSEEHLAPGVIQNGEIADHITLAKTLTVVASRHNIKRANITLPEARGYLFEADVNGTHKREWRTGVEQHLDEYVPLPPTEVAFDIAPLITKGDTAHVVGIGYARRVADAAIQVFEDAGIEVRSIESETFALPRAIISHGDSETVMVVDIGKTTTKLLVISRRLPRFATTLEIGGHALTLAVQKYFGVTEEEAKLVKAEKGLVADADNAEYQAAMLTTMSVIREEIVRRLDYWQSRAGQITAHAPVTRAILVGGNATLRGLPEYLAASLKIPVELGDVFRNLASRK